MKLGLIVSNWKDWFKVFLFVNRFLFPSLQIFMITPSYSVPFSATPTPCALVDGSGRNRLNILKLAEKTAQSQTKTIYLDFVYTLCSIFTWLILSEAQPSVPTFPPVYAANKLISIVHNS